MDFKVEKTGAGYVVPADIENDYNVKNEDFNTEKSIFSSNDVQLTEADASDLLKQEFDSIKKEQGIIGKAWDKFKNITGLGLGSNDVEDKIKQYENGEISYDEALASIQSFDSKQDGMVDMAANVVSGLAVAGSAVLTGGTSLLAGAAIGGAVKAGIKTADRATNEIEGDALNAKQIIKDGVTGAVDGAVTVATAGMVKAPVLGQSVGKAVTTGAIQGAKAGAISGAASSAASYAVEAAVEEDVDFSVKEYLKAAAQGAAVGGAFGGVLGGVTGGVAQSKLNKPEVRQLANNLGMQDGNIQDSEALSKYLAKNKKVDINELNNYIENVDKNALYQAAPSVENYTPQQNLDFYDYHYQSGTSTWDSSTLSLPDDLTQYLKDNYLDSDGMTKLLDKYPLTNRQVGEMPNGWLDAISPENQAAAQKEVYEAISKFQTSGNIDDLADDLTKTLGKDVKIKKLDSGCFGTGYKVSVDGVDDVCLKTFHGKDNAMLQMQLDMQAEMLKKMGMSDKAVEAFNQQQLHKMTNMHGGGIEVQTGLFVNEHSDDFVKMYFGKVAGANDGDAFLVTQFLDDSVTPVSTGAKGGYKIKSGDAFKGESFIGKIFGGQDHNIINGKIIDFGAVKVKKNAFGLGA